LTGIEMSTFLHIEKLSLLLPNIILCLEIYFIVVEEGKYLIIFRLDPIIFENLLSALMGESENG